MPDKAAGMLKSVHWLLVLSWWLYPIAYLIPVISFTASGVIVRQIIFTVADITSKVIYGVMLSRLARIRSEAEGYQQDTIGIRERVLDR